MAIPTKLRESAQDFPPGVKTREQKLLYIAQYASMAAGQLFSAAWGTKPKDQAGYLMNARDQYRFVAGLCESIAVDAMRGEGD